MTRLKNIPFTQQGFELLQKEREELKATRPAAITELATARAMGDLSENSAYKVARSKVSGIDSRIRRLDMVLKEAVIVQTRTDGKIDIGCTVTIQNGTDISVYSIVGGFESDIQSGKLSHISPIGKALMGKKKGDQIILFAPVGKISLQVIEVKYT